MKAHRRAKAQWNRFVSLRTINVYMPHKKVSLQCAVARISREPAILSLLLVWSKHDELSPQVYHMWVILVRRYVNARGRERDLIIYGKYCAESKEGAICRRRIIKKAITINLFVNSLRNQNQYQRPVDWKVYKVRQSFLGKRHGCKPR